MCTGMVGWSGEGGRVRTNREDRDGGGGRDGRVGSARDKQLKDTKNKCDWALGLYNGVLSLQVFWHKNNIHL